MSSLSKLLHRPTKETLSYYLVLKLPAFCQGKQFHAALHLILLSWQQCENYGL